MTTTTKNANNYCICLDRGAASRESLEGVGAEPRNELSPWDVQVGAGIELVPRRSHEISFYFRFFFYASANGVARLGNPLQVVVAAAAAVAVVVCLLHVIGRGSATAGGT